MLTAVDLPQAPKRAEVGQLKALHDKKEKQKNKEQKGLDIVEGFLESAEPRSVEKQKSTLAGLQTKSAMGTTRPNFVGVAKRQIREKIDRFYDKMPFKPMDEKFKEEQHQKMLRLHKEKINSKLRQLEKQTTFRSELELKEVDSSQPEPAERYQERTRHHLQQDPNSQKEVRRLPADDQENGRLRQRDARAHPARELQAATPPDRRAVGHQRLRERPAQKHARPLQSRHLDPAEKLPGRQRRAAASQAPERQEHQSLQQQQVPSRLLPQQTRSPWLTRKNSTQQTSKSSPSTSTTPKSSTR